MGMGADPEDLWESMRAETACSVMSVLPRERTNPIREEAAREEISWVVSRDCTISRSRWNRGVIVSSGSFLSAPKIRTNLLIDTILSWYSSAVSFSSILKLN